MNYLIPFLLVSFFSLVLFFFFIGFNLIIFSIKRNETKNVVLSSLPSVSILIAMKNEKENIGKLVESLAKLNYPEEKFEIVLVDDNSADGTYESARELTSNFKNAKVLKAEEKPFAAKKGALAFGLNFCSYENIALTDADCFPEPDWLLRVSEALSKFDVAFGAAPLLASESFASRFASYESGKNQIYNLGALKTGIPLSATGRNFAYRKSAFEKIGGYENTLDTLSGDDDLLLREAFKRKLKIGFIRGDNASVYSRAPKTWREYLRQRARHVKTSHHYTFVQKVFAFGVFAGGIVTTYSFLLAPVNFFFVLPSVLSLKIAYSAYEKFRDFFGVRVSFFELLLFELIYPAVLIVNFIFSLFGADEWKITENKRT